MLGLLAALLQSETLEERVKSVMPTFAEERWLDIGWRTDIRAARIEAQKNGKPLFFWVMNGHPMGCT